MVRVELTNGGQFIIDDELYDSIMQYSWHYKDGYVVSNQRINNKQCRLHRYIMGGLLGHDIIGKHVHHKNEDKLDNRITNLEILTPMQHLSKHWLGKKRPELSLRNIGNKYGLGNTNGRLLAGDKNGRSVITDEVWLDTLEQQLINGWTNAEVARKLNIQRTQVGYVWKGKSRKHLQPQIQELLDKYN